MLPHKMAVPLLLASEQLLCTLHKGTSVVVVEEGLLLIHFQPAWFSQPAGFFSHLEATVVLLWLV